MNTKFDESVASARKKDEYKLPGVGSVLYFNSRNQVLFIADKDKRVEAARSFAQLRAALQSTLRSENAEKERIEAVRIMQRNKAPRTRKSKDNNENPSSDNVRENDDDDEENSSSGNVKDDENSSSGNVRDDKTPLRRIHLAMLGFAAEKNTKMSYSWYKENVRNNNGLFQRKFKAITTTKRKVNAYSDLKKLFDDGGLTPKQYELCVQEDLYGPLLLHWKNQNIQKVPAKDLIDKRAVGALTMIGETEDLSLQEKFRDLLSLVENEDERVCHLLLRTGVVRELPTLKLDSYRWSSFLGCMAEAVKENKYVEKNLSISEKALDNAFYILIDENNNKSEWLEEEEENSYETPFPEPDVSIKRAPRQGGGIRIGPSPPQSIRDVPTPPPQSTRNVPPSPPPQSTRNVPSPPPPQSTRNVPPSPPRSPEKELDDDDDTSDMLQYSVFDTNRSRALKKSLENRCSKLDEEIDKEQGVQDAHIVVEQNRQQKRKRDEEKSSESQSQVIKKKVRKVRKRVLLSSSDDDEQISPVRNETPPPLSEKSRSDNASSSSNKRSSPVKNQIAFSDDEEEQEQGEIENKRTPSLAPGGRQKRARPVSIGRGDETTLLVVDSDDDTAALRLPTQRNVKHLRLREGEFVLSVYGDETQNGVVLRMKNVRAKLTHAMLDEASGRQTYAPPTTVSYNENVLRQVFTLAPTIGRFEYLYGQYSANNVYSVVYEFGGPDVFEAYTVVLVETDMSGNRIKRVKSGLFKRKYQRPGKPLESEDASPNILLTSLVQVNNLGLAIVQTRDGIKHMHINENPNERGKRKPPFVRMARVGDITTHQCGHLSQTTNIVSVYSRSQSGVETLSYYAYNDNLDEMNAIQIEVLEQNDERVRGEGVVGFARARGVLAFLVRISQSDLRVLIASKDKPSDTVEIAALSERDLSGNFRTAQIHMDARYVYVSASGNGIVAIEYANEQQIVRSAPAKRARLSSDGEGSASQTQRFAFSPTGVQLWQDDDSTAQQEYDRIVTKLEIYLEELIDDYNYRVLHVDAFMLDEKEEKEFEILSHVNEALQTEKILFSMVRNNAYRLLALFCYTWLHNVRVEDIEVEKRIREIQKTRAAHGSNYDRNTVLDAVPQESLVKLFEEIVDKQGENSIMIQCLAPFFHQVLEKDTLKLLWKNRVFSSAVTYGVLYDEEQDRMLLPDAILSSDRSLLLSQKVAYGKKNFDKYMSLWSEVKEEYEEGGGDW